MNEYSFTKEYMDHVNNNMSDKDRKTLEHFGYKKPVGAVSSTGCNAEPFKNIGFVIQTLGIDKTRKTRIIFDYDPDFAHCLIQINQSDKGNEITRKEVGKVRDVGIICEKTQNALESYVDYVKNCIDEAAKPGKMVDYMKLCECIRTLNHVSGILLKLKELESGEGSSLTIHNNYSVNY